MSNKLKFNNDRLEYMPSQYNYWCGVEVLDENFKSIRFDIKPEENNITEYIFQHEIKYSDDFNVLSNILISSTLKDPSNAEFVLDPFALKAM